MLQLAATNSSMPQPAATNSSMLQTFEFVAAILIISSQNILKFSAAGCNILEYVAAFWEFGNLRITMSNKNSFQVPEDLGGDT